MELIDFINNKKSHKKLNKKKIVTYFNKCIIKSIIELDSKFNKIDNKTNTIISGINMIYNVFFIIIFYSNNIKLTIFLVERAIMLYTEFIIMSQDKTIIDDLCFIPNITDAISFSYKKTISPLNIGKLNIKYDQQSIKDVAFIIKNVVTSYYIEYKDKFNETYDKLDKFENILYEVFNKLDNNNHIFIIKFINNLLETTKLDDVLNIIIDINNYLNINHLNINYYLFQNYCNNVLKGII